MRDRQKTFMYVAIGVGVLLLFFLFVDSSSTIGMVEQLLTYAMAALAGYYIVTAGVRMGTGAAN
jgi:hypothetical protein